MNVVVDAFNVRTGGAIVLLQYLLEEINGQGVGVYLTINEEVSSHKFIAKQVKRLKSFQLLKRESILKTWSGLSEVSLVLCFGNYPPIKKLRVPVVVYFHNAHLVKWRSGEPVYKKLILKNSLRNADYFIFQSERLRNQFVKFYKYKLLQTRVIPFYNGGFIRSFKKELVGFQEPIFIYNSLPYKHKNYPTLFAAWEILQSRGNAPQLHITVPDFFQGVKQEVPAIDSIENHGWLDHEALLELMSTCTHCIFPSSAESLGLGLVEAAELGLSVIAADEPYVNDVILPSATFRTNDSVGCADLVSSIVKGGELPETELIKGNQIDNLLKLIVDVRA